MRIRILPYKQGSKSAKALAEALNGKVLKLEGSKFQPSVGDLIINWGRSNYGPLTHFHPLALLNVVNDPDWTGYVSNKLRFFNELKCEGYQDIIPKFWTNKEEIPEDAYPIVCRTVLSGHSGAGIVLARTPSELVEAPLYVQYVKKKDEYRVHVGLKDNPNLGECEAKVIAIQRKARRTDHPNPNWQVRNHANGFVYARSNVNPPASVVDVARKALEATGLDFGAVDVIWNEKEEKAYALEINTAPGLEGQTVTDYANFFQGLAT